MIEGPGLTISALGSNNTN